ncbi:membrane protein insertase YidC [Virgibacillus salinus]|uniref:Membrane protein insertase YidC n=1 Tax=Virgibacillus salinus TaxID=553311 RepID=A0A1H1DK56_9BACI|nr:membrane protein insertase YidC [Virgibacillus salinus]SDQ76629.1 YidC/Oxa1 family membrane protein insertase [Virgibacillus salinus]
MQRNTVFTFFRKYSFVAIILVVFLTGCTTNGASSFGWFNHYFVDPFSLFIKYTASLLGDNFGLSIILITILIRLAIMPFMLKQLKSSKEMQEKMKMIKPEMDVIKEKYKDNKETDAKMQMQKEMTELYQKHQLNPISSMGCLPMIIQFPILIGFYYAIRQTPEIATHSFMWFNLGHSDMMMTFLAVIVYFIQFRVTQIGMDPKQKKQIAFLGLLPPLMIGFVSFSAPAALPLYWAVGGLFLIIQTIITKKRAPAN